MSKCQCTIKSTRNICMLLDYINITKFNPIKLKRLHVPTPHFYKLIRLHILSKFCSSLSIRVSDSVQTLMCSKTKCTDKTCHKLHHYIPARSTRHQILLHNSTILHTKIFCASLSPAPEHIAHDKPVTFYTTTFPNKTDSIQTYIPFSWIILLLIESYTSLIKHKSGLDYFPLGRIRHKSNQKIKLSRKIYLLV